MDARFSAKDSRRLLIVVYIFWGIYESLSLLAMVKWHTSIFLDVNQANSVLDVIIRSTYKRVYDHSIIFSFFCLKLFELFAKNIQLFKRPTYVFGSASLEFISIGFTLSSANSSKLQWVEVRRFFMYLWASCIWSCTEGRVGCLLSFHTHSKAGTPENHTRCKRRTSLRQRWGRSHPHISHTLVRSNPSVALAAHTQKHTPWHACACTHCI